ncbi:MAG: FtsX-like permease family protein [Nostoc sp. GBBB01]|uniref:ABC transporter permease n=1 Tax=Nostoc punctiforme FACHB-252 TaxID=1357509 RepID=A0ABR8HEI3_NOSPU|nr:MULTISPECIES: ABC transporter permease [Nostoc]MBC1242093.1 ABC transporter permease [Nostoc sp. 2RC]MBD2613513.1 ABC transporter permease [Nostoc punctiforme FACHB-252]MBL1203183.1 FtsX-like permease family protein [Nostoc sp. GBBB01]MDZ8012181.1 ABC transporter permease [Nostoc sp. ZfuVER08]
MFKGFYKAKNTRTVPLSEILSMAVETLWSNKLRTGLTMLGVIIGISSVIAITSVGQGVQKGVEQQIQALGTDVLQILAGAARSGNVRQGIGSSSTLTWEDAQAIATDAPSVQLVSAYLQRSAQVVYAGQNTSTTIYGTDLNYPEVRNTHPQQGRYFTQAELNGAVQVAVLGPTVQRTLFGQSSNVIGQRIRIQGEAYEVIGVMEPKGSQGPMDRDDQIFIPLTSMSARLVGNNALVGVSVTGILVKSANQEDLEAAQFQVTNLLRLRHNIYPPQADDFRLTNQADIVSTFTNVVGLFTVMVVAIAGISLVVGGIGIANIMLVSVVERTREIGIRKAVGATRSAILNQFLAEAIVISIAGGCIGMVGGIIIAYAAANIFKFPFVISVLSIIAGFGLSITVGLIAGVIPARNASKLDPIIALRSD